MTLEEKIKFREKLFKDKGIDIDFYIKLVGGEEEYKKKLERWEPSFQDKHPLFFKKIGGTLFYDFCNGLRLSYHCDALEKKGEHCSFDVGFLTTEEVDKLLEKSEKDNFDYLYQAVKEHPYYINPNVLY